MAREIGWSERLAKPAAMAAQACGSASPQVCQCTNVGSPGVSVPVLSSAMARSWRAASSALPPLIKMPRCAAAVSALTTVTGVEITKAQGQAMTSSAKAW